MHPLLLLFIIAVILAGLLLASVAIARRQPPREHQVERRAVDDRWATELYPPRYHRAFGDEPERPIEVSALRAALARGEPLTPAQVDEVIVDIAFDLEFRARRVFAGQQFRGILRGRHTIVWSGSDGQTILALLRRLRPGPEARAHLDRALAWWSAARRAGARVYEWDRPGYDDVTHCFDGLEDLAEAAVAIDPAAHGVVVRAWTETRRTPGDPFPWRTLLRPIALLIALVLLLLRQGGPSRPALADPPPTCTESQVTARARAHHLGERRPELRPRLDLVIAALDAGDPARAADLWKDPQGDPEARLLGVQLFLASSTCAAARSDRRSPP